jgi:hypothetical protein
MERKVEKFRRSKVNIRKRIRGNKKKRKRIGKANKIK